MITLLIFLLLTAIETVVVLLKWNDVTDMHEVGKFASSALGYDKEYLSITNRVIVFLKKMKPLLWFFAILALIANLIIAFLLSFVINLITHFI